MLGRVDRADILIFSFCHGTLSLQRAESTGLPAGADRSPWRCCPLLHAVNQRGIGLDRFAALRLGRPGMVLRRGNEALEACANGCSNEQRDQPPD
jgi:hypothetical protein